MSLKTTEYAYAKINLLLDIAGVREDGYHLIDGVMQTISLADRLEVELEESSKTTVTVSMLHCNRQIEQTSNLAYKAAILFLQTIEKTATLNISIEKNIPISSGLAGGSTDAAATLRAVNRLFGFPLNMTELCALGARLGADVPFCIRGGAMRTEGIGDLLTPCPSLPACYMVVSRLDLENLDCDTKEMYRKLDERYNRFEGCKNPASKVEKLIQVLRKGDLAGVCKLLENIFEDAVFSEFGKRLSGLKKRMLLQDGAIGALMSGSGSAIYCIFQNRQEAEKASANLSAELGVRAWLCHPISKEFFSRS